MRQRRPIIHKSPWMGLVLGVFVALVFVLARPQILDTFEYRVTDLNMRFRGTAPARNDIRIVAITNEDLSLLGRWPWPRRTHGDLTDCISQFDPRAIVFDLFFPEYDGDWANEIKGGAVSERTREAMESDLAFAQAIAESGKVYLANILNYKSLVDAAPLDKRIQERFGAPLPGRGAEKLRSARAAINSITEFVEPARGVGMINCDPDADGVTRRIPLVANYGGRLFFSMDLLVICDLFSIKPADLPISLGEFIQIPTLEGPIQIPIDDQGRMLVNFRSLESADPYVHDAVSYQGVFGALHNFMEGKPAQDFFNITTFKDTIVVVGMTAEGSPETDIKAVPFDNNYPMVGVHAHAIANILNRDFLYELPPWASNLVLVFIGLIIGSLMQRLSPVRAFIAVVLALSLWYLFSLFIFLRTGTILPVIRPVIVIFLTFALVVLYHYLTEQRQRRWATTLLGSYVNEETIREIINNPDLLQPGGARTAVTVLFSDIRGFTAMAEQIPAEEVVALLNEHFGLMTEVIHRYNGTVDKFVGDEIMVLFGAPKPLENSALNAVRAALEMQKVMRALQERRGRTGLRTFQIAIGIHTGEAVVGHLGTEKKLQYTAIGDNVNLAKRLEAQALGGQILISRAVQDRIHNAIPATPLPPIRVKGKAEPVEVFEVQVS